MQFFLPGAGEAAEAVYAELCRQTGVGLVPPDGRLRSVRYRHEGQRMRAEVGQPVDPFYALGDGPVIALIPVGQGVAICLPGHGIGGGRPIAIEGEAVLHRSYFQAPALPFFEPRKRSSSARLLSAAEFWCFQRRAEPSERDAGP